MSWLITGAQPVNWTPANTTTALWLDAADASTITTVSGAVSQWNDKSGNGRNATQVTGATRPAFTANGLNSKSVVSFIGSASSASQYLNVTLDIYQSAFILYSNTNVIAFATPLGGSYNTAGDPVNTRGAPYHGANDSSAIFDSVYTRTETLNGQNFANGASIGNGLSTARPATPTIFSHIATTAFAAQNGLRIVGADSLAASRGITGLIAEVIMLAGPASTYDRQRIEGYLAHKWGLAASLPGDHPFKTAIPAP